MENYTFDHLKPTQAIRICLSPTHTQSVIPKGILNNQTMA